LEEARKLYERVLKSDPKNFEACQLLGTLYTHEDNHDEAIFYLNKAISLSPSNALPYFNKGVLLTKVGKIEEAISCYGIAGRIKPDYFEAFNNRANLLIKIKCYEDALNDFDYIIKNSNAAASAHFNKANLLKRLGRNKEALFEYEMTLKIKNDYFEAYLNKGVLLKESYDIKGAIENYQKALKISPENIDALYNLGNSLQEDGQIKKALHLYNKIIELNPNHHSARWNKSLALLLQGDFKNGWKEYECRTTIKKQILCNGKKLQEWRGEKSIRNKKIIISSEQGLGDSIQFFRYLPKIIEMQGTPIFRVQSPLKELFQDFDTKIKVIDEKESIPNADFHCPLMSLPYAFRTTLDTIPNNTPYLRADKKLKFFFENAIKEKGKIKIGIAWSGAANHKNDRNRSLALSQLFPVINNNRFEFHSLQKEYRGGDQIIIEDNDRLMDHSKTLKSFSDTAALIECMDLVISVDTSVAHLSGALGKRTWILLPFMPDFRWLLERKDSPWYPTVDLFRQEKIGKWDEVIQQINIALDSYHGG